MSSDAEEETSDELEIAEENIATVARATGQNRARPRGPRRGSQPRSKSEMSKKL